VTNGKEMINVISFSRDDVSERELFGLHIQTADQLDQLCFSSPKFICFLAWDASQETVEAISHVAEKLLNSGCVYFCAWGNDCERVHDITDEVCVSLYPSEDDESVIMTTWHKDESLDEALWFFLRCTWPDDHYFDICNSVVAISIGCSLEVQERINFALNNPGEFTSLLIENRDTSLFSY
jgi:hypothetical protein